MHTDYPHRIGHSSRRHTPFIWLNVAVLIGALSIYAVSRFFIVPHIRPGIWRSHGHDFLALPVLLSASNLYILALRGSVYLIVRPLPAILLALVMGAFWEYVTPLYRHSTSDPLDLIAYVLGAVFYCIIVRCRAKTPNKTPTAVGAVSSAIAVHIASRRWFNSTLGRFPPTKPL